ncbi:MAG: glucose-6-phosphate isomerase [Rhodospirillaceae bacterium]|nr:glucose-6-phosphate isomerase [Rhodospirillaceae bacterium]|tara:strand:+ start:390 stop:1622 length:1233 start_codon:yes stop_codon:yes gene_type:complete
MTYRLSVDSLPSGDDACLASLLERAVTHACKELEAGRLHALSIARERDDLDGLKAHAERMVDGAECIVVLGAGGSSLAGQALAALRDDASERLVFLDNIDPETWQRLWSHHTPGSLRFLTVSKSGGTAETMAQLLLALDAMESAGLDARSWLTAVTEPGARPLRELAEAHNAPVIDHPADVGGRFSALSVSGLLPAVLAGLDPTAVRQGAEVVLDDFLGNGSGSAPARAAHMAVAHERAGIGVQVLLAYADRLAPLARWWVQLWGESLGKDGKGSTPVAARGANDQHSQLQLWRDGTRRHMVTVLGTDPGSDTSAMTTARDDLSYLHGHTLGDLFRAERDATVDSLASVGVPVRQLICERADEHTMGALFAHFMIETILAAHMIGVDPFGQPAVEDGKQRTRETLWATAP